MKRTLAAVALLMAALAWAQDTAVAPRAPGTIPTDRPSENIALGASYTLEPGPNYGLCSDPGDAEQLTDGVYTDGYFWAQLSTVGWQEKTPSIESMARTGVAHAGVALARQRLGAAHILALESVGSAAAHRHAGHGGGMDRRGASDAQGVPRCGVQCEQQQ